MFCRNCKTYFIMPKVNVVHYDVSPFTCINYKLRHYVIQIVKRVFCIIKCIFTRFNAITRWIIYFSLIFLDCFEWTSTLGDVNISTACDRFNSQWEVSNKLAMMTSHRKWRPIGHSTHPAMLSGNKRSRGNRLSKISMVPAKNDLF